MYKSEQLRNKGYCVQHYLAAKLSENDVLIPRFIKKNEYQREAKEGLYKLTYKVSTKIDEKNAANKVVQGVISLLLLNNIFEKIKLYNVEKDILNDVIKCALKRVNQAFLDSIERVDLRVMGVDEKYFKPFETFEFKYFIVAILKKVKYNKALENYEKDVLLKLAEEVKLKYAKYEVFKTIVKVPSINDEEYFSYLRILSMKLRLTAGLNHLDRIILTRCMNQSVIDLKNAVKDKNFFFNTFEIEVYEKQVIELLRKINNNEAINDSEKKILFNSVKAATKGCGKLRNMGHKIIS